MIRPLIALVFASTVAHAAVQGTVQNLTTGKPQPNAVVTLMELGSGMNNLGSARTDASGKFTFNADLNPSVPHLIQALHMGITYNRMLQPGTPSGDISLEVYDAAVRAPEAQVAQHMILLEPTGTELMINESIIFSNTGKLTFQDPDGTLKISVPSEVNTPVRVRIVAPAGMPITREAEKGKQPNTYVVRYPIKPGETRIDVQYSVAGAPATYTGRILHGGQTVRIVAPKGVTLEGPGLTDLGPEPRTQARVYDVKGEQFTLAINGTGTLRDPSESADAGSSEPAADDAPGLDVVKPRLYERTVAVVALVFAMLGIGFVMLYRTA